MNLLGIIRSIIIILLTSTVCYTLWLMGLAHSNHNIKTSEYTNETKNRIVTLISIAVDQQNKPTSATLQSLQNLRTRNSSKTKVPARFLVEPKNLFNGECDLKNSKCKSINSNQMCETMLSLVVFIKSKTNYFERREAIRNTWGRYFFVNSVRVERIFVLGKAGNEEDQEKIEHEGGSNGDILQYSGPDDYRNMPKKVMSAMQWTSENLPLHFLYASSDDDFIVNLAGAIDFLHNELAKRVVGNRTREEAAQSLPIMCVYFLSSTTKPERNENSKYYVSEREYSSNMYPAFCGGGFYVMPVSMVGALFEMAEVTQSVPMDDVWVTGILRQKLGHGDSNIMAASWPLEAPKPLWKHFWGDYGKIQKNIVQLTKNTWNMWEKLLFNLPHCIR